MCTASCQIFTIWLNGASEHLRAPVSEGVYTRLLCLTRLFVFELDTRHRTERAALISDF
jgi:hypothetical protein